MLHTGCNMDLQQKHAKMNLPKSFDNTFQRFWAHQLLQSSDREEEFQLLIEELKLHHSLLQMF